MPYQIPNDLTDEEKADCEEEWERALKFCAEIEEKEWFEDKDKHFGKCLDQCVGGMVSIKCSGNPNKIEA